MILAEGMERGIYISTHLLHSPSPILSFALVQWLSTERSLRGVSYLSHRPLHCPGQPPSTVTAPKVVTEPTSSGAPEETLPPSATRKTIAADPTRSVAFSYDQRSAGEIESSAGRRRALSGSFQESWTVTFSKDHSVRRIVPGVIDKFEGSRSGDCTGRQPQITIQHGMEADLRKYATCLIGSDVEYVTMCLTASTMGRYKELFSVYDADEPVIFTFKSGSTET